MKIHQKIETLDCNEESKDSEAKEIMSIEVVYDAIDNLREFFEQYGLPDNYVHIILKRMREGTENIHLEGKNLAKHE